MSELKIEHITTSHGDTFQITRGETTVSLSPAEAVLVLQFLYERNAELASLVNDLPASEPLLQECPYCGGHHPSGTVEQCPLRPFLWT